MSGAPHPRDTVRSAQLHVSEACRLIAEVKRPHGLWPALDNALSRLRSAQEDLEVLRDL